MRNRHPWQDDAWVGDRETGYPKPKMVEIGKSEEASREPQAPVHRLGSKKSTEPSEPSRDPVLETVEEILDRTAAVLEHMAQGFRTDQETIRRLRRG